MKAKWKEWREFEPLCTNRVNIPCAELRELVNYVDTLEAVARGVVTFSDFHGEPEPLASLAERLREALNKGK